MRRILITVVLTAALLLLVATFASAQGVPGSDGDGGGVPQVTDPSIVIEPFAWFFQDPRNYAAGILFFVIGAAGALVTTYLAVGDVMPGTAGNQQLSLRAREVEVTKNLAQHYRERADKLNEDPAVSQEKVNYYREAYRLEADRASVQQEQLDREKNTQFRIGSFFYVGLGAFFATALAQDFFQALVIGAGWPTAYGALALKRQVQTVTSSNAALEREVKAVTTDNAALKQQVVSTTPILQEVQRILTPIVNDPQSMLGKRAPAEIGPSMNKLKRLV